MSSPTQTPFADSFISRQIQLNGNASFSDTAGTTRNQLDGNNSFQLLSKLDKLEAAKLGGPEAEDGSELLLPVTAEPIIKTMKALLKVVEGTMGHGLNPKYRDLIATYRNCLMELPHHMMETFGVKVSYTWKEHILTGSFEFLFSSLQMFNVQFLRLNVQCPVGCS